MPSQAQNLPDDQSVKNDVGINLDICQCSGCGLVQLDTDTKPVSYYREVIRSSAFSAEMREFRLQQFRQLVAKYSLAGEKMVEIGCGRGEYLGLMKEAGVDAYGLEYGPDLEAECQRNGLKVSCGYIDSVDYGMEAAPFAAFFILNFLEHFPEPNVALRAVYKNLSDGAVGLVEVPNFDMMLRAALFSEFTRDHLLYFTKRTLTLTLELNGFEVLSCDEVWHDYSISAMVKKRVQLDLASLRRHRAKIKDDLNEFLSKFRAVAIWGAGHQALAILSMMDLGRRVKYVVDAAPFKQGKFTPATHIPIVAPESLRSQPVEAIIIMAGSYSDEVKNIIKKGFDPGLTVAVLRDFGLEL